MKRRPFFILPLMVGILLALMVLPQTAGPATPEPSEDRPVPGPVVQPTDGPTQPVTQTPTEPGPQVFTLSFVGDCTLGASKANWDNEFGFIRTVGEDYDYPMALVRHIFESDDFTMANLEGPLTEEGTPADKTFVFRGPAAYTAILTGSSIEAVTMANNHAWDYGETGRRNTAAALEAAGISYGLREQSYLHTTASGLTIGVYCDDFAFDRSHMEGAIAGLRQQGAEIVICAFHWGVEKAYKPNLDQTIWAHAAIDAGADIVYGHHPHVLQPIEVYHGGVIYYSLGNFCFGGALNVTDRDSAVIRQQVIRQPDGTVSLGDTVSIPVSITSAPDRNNYQPIPLEAGTEAYDRVLAKLDGTY